MRNARASLSRRASTSREAESSSRRAAGSSAISAAQNNAISTQTLKHNTGPGARSWSGGQEWGQDQANQGARKNPRKESEPRVPSERQR